MKFRDLNKQYQQLKNEIDAAIHNVIQSASFILGSPVMELEEKLADYVGVKHCVTCANGTDALQLVLMAWGIGPGDAVFTSDFTFFASAGAVSILGATPVFVDIDNNTYNINFTALENAVMRINREGTLTPTVIIPVDLFGLPADYKNIELIAKKYNLKILEDAAQGFGGQLNGQRACSFGDAAITSFFPAKPLGCYGDGGAIFTNDDDLDSVLRSLRSQGRSPEDKYDNRCIGINSRLDTLQAGILLPKLKAFSEYELDMVNQVSHWYKERLPDTVIKPYIPEGYISSWAQYTIRVKLAIQRDALRNHLQKHTIPTMIYYPRGLHQQEAYYSMALSDNEFPYTVAAAQTVLSLPMHPYLTENDVDTVIKTINEFFY